VVACDGTGKLLAAVESAAAVVPIPPLSDVEGVVPAFSCVVDPTGGIAACARPPLESLACGTVEAAEMPCVVLASLSRPTANTQVSSTCAQLWNDQNPSCKLLKNPSLSGGQCGKCHRVKGGEGNRKRKKKKPTRGVGLCACSFGASLQNGVSPARARRGTLQRTETESKRAREGARGGRIGGVGQKCGDLQSRVQAQPLGWCIFVVWRKQP
jgi:hypothetical protein